MVTPDYLQQVVISGRRGHTSAARTGVFRRPSVPNLLWATLDLLTVLVAGLIAIRVRGLGLPQPNGELLKQLTLSPSAVSLAYLALYGVYLLLFSKVYGLYGSSQNRSGWHEQRMTIQAGFTAGLVLCGTLYATRGFVVPRTVSGLTILLSTAMMMTQRGLCRLVMRKRYLDGLQTRNVLIVGVGRVAHALRSHLEALRHMGFRFKGFIALDAAEANAGNADVVGNVADCMDLARAFFVDEIYFSTPADRNVVMGLVESARAAGIDVRVVPDLYDGLAWNAPVEYIGQFPTIPLHRREFKRGAVLIKRALDVLVASIAVVLLSPILLALAIWIKLDSPGGVIYPAKRIGRKGRTFDCYKFRTMVQDADRKLEDLQHRNERDSVLFKITNDPRVTRVGRLLRKYSLDELPQFFNVLKGDMSLVGPRPPIAAEVAQYDLAHLRRLDVLPGMTGLWQVEARQDPSFDSYISLDTAYVENWSLMLDMRILARTVGVVLSGTGS